MNFSKNKNKIKKMKGYTDFGTLLVKPVIKSITN